MHCFFVSHWDVLEFRVEGGHFCKVPGEEWVVCYCSEFQETAREAVKGDVFLEGSVCLEDEVFIMFWREAEIAESANAMVTAPLEGKQEG